MKKTHCFILLFSLPVAGALAADALPEKVDYNRDIKQILSNNCYACHGPDENKLKGDLRLETFEGATKEI